jgi:hypothetical protein
LQSRRGIQHVDVPPIQSSLVTDPPAQPAATSSSSGGAPTHAINGEMYVADGDYIQDIEVNDLRNRYLITKGSTQKMVNALETTLIPPDLPMAALTSPMSRISCLLGTIARMQNPFVAPADARLK